MLLLYDFCSLFAAFLLDLEPSISFIISNLVLVDLTLLGLILYFLMLLVVYLYLLLFLFLAVFFSTFTLTFGLTIGFTSAVLLRFMNSNNFFLDLTDFGLVLVFLKLAIFILGALLYDTAIIPQTIITDKNGCEFLTGIVDFVLFLNLVFIVIFNHFSKHHTVLILGQLLPQFLKIVYVQLL